VCRKADTVNTRTHTHTHTHDTYIVLYNIIRIIIKVITYDLARGKLRTRPGGVARAVDIIYRYLVRYCTLQYIYNTLPRHNNNNIIHNDIIYLPCIHFASTTQGRLIHRVLVLLVLGVVSAYGTNEKKK